MNFPLTALFTGILGLIFLYLSFAVVGARRANSVGIGDGGVAKLQQAIRAHGNFAEYTPLCLILFFTAELNAAPSWILYAFGVLLVYGRLFHGIGLLNNPGVSWQRFSGMIATFLVLLGLSVFNLGVFAASYFNI